MPKILILFASKSDSEVYNEIARLLKKHRVDFDVRLCSAHKSPDDVGSIIKNTNYDVVISGAGLSAALPGVIASKTIRPVIGVPIKNNYEGLDALLSIAQMPSGVPVLAVGVNKADVAVENAVNILKDYSGATIISDDEENQAVKKAVAILKDFGISYKFAKNPDSSTVNLEFAYFDEQVEKKDELVIYCPLLIEDEHKADSALNFLKHTSHGLWVGLNNGTNAGLSAVEILNKNNSLTKKLMEYRESMRKKLILDDNALKSK